MPVFTTTIIILIVALLAAYFAVPTTMRKHVGTGLLIACSVFVGAFFVQVFKGQARPQSLQALVAEERAEMTLRMMTTINVGVTKFTELSGFSFLDDKDAKSKNKSVMEVSSENLGPFFKTAREALDEAIKYNPKSAELKAKKAILAAVSDSKKAPTKEIRQLCKQLMNSQELEARRLGVVLNRTLVDEKPLPPTTVVPTPPDKETKTDSANSKAPTKPELSTSGKSESSSKDRSRQDAGAPGIEPNSQKSASSSKDRSRQDAGAPGIEPNSQKSASSSKDQSRQDAGAPGIEPNSQKSESQNEAGAKAEDREGSTSNKQESSAKQNEESNQTDSGETNSTIASENLITPKDAIPILEKGISKGWYQENAKLLYFTASHNKSELSKLRKQLEERYFDKFRFMILAYSVGGLCAFIGLVTIVIHFGSLGRKDPKEIPLEERVGIDLDLRTIYSVFVGWLTVELMMSQLFKLLPKNMLNLGSNPVGIATFSLISYVVTMVPAFLLIYFIAFKPRGYKFFEALKQRLRTPTSSPLKLILAGFLSWSAIIPMVVLGALIASNLLGSQGSDNPVLSQISMVANSGNTLAIALLYFTVAAAAPFFEEVIFRGFLYSSLKTRWGIFPAILISAFVFAFIHFDKGGALMLFALGPVLAVSYERTRSLLPPMIAHGLWNGGSFAMAVSLYYQ
ncbi:MAG: CPBP family intramembrane metalloprotease [Candidatus Obscuribacterales bacterium]|nr:CPBP family intramembrane metalloprotease [Candidatus Obscuribacterales bacterium]